MCEELSGAAADGWEPILHPGTLYSRRLFINDLMPPEGALLLRHSFNKQELIYLIFKSYALIKKWTPQDCVWVAVAADTLL